MTPKQLLTPRIIVLADYPNSAYRVGQVLTLTTEVFVYPAYCSDDALSGIGIGEADKYPHLFESIEWHEHRDLADMPKYVKAVNGKMFSPLKVKKWLGYNKSWCHLLSDDLVDKNGPLSVGVGNCLPATEEEYLAAKIK